MGWAKKKVKKTAKSVKKVAKSVVKVVKTVVKPITKVVKTVAKSIVNVGKKIVSGVKSAVKSVGKSLSKLGPLASIALMAIPGFQAFGASLASGLGFSSTLAANMATGAMTGFITSGGSLKGAVVGGAMAGAGSYLGDVAKGTWNSGSLQTGFAQANTAAMANNAFTGGMTGMQGFQAGIDSAAKEWGNFTNKIGDFFSSQTSTGDITKGTEAFAGTYEQYGMSPTEYVDTYGKLPPALSGSTQQAQMLAEQQAAFTGDVEATAWTEEAYKPPQAWTPEGTPELVQEDWNKVVNELGIDPQGQQAKMLAEQQFGGTEVDAGGWATYDQSLAFSAPEDLLLTAQSGQAGTPTYMAPPSSTSKDPSKLIDSLLSGSGGGASRMPFTTSVNPIDISLKGAGAVGGAGGLLGFTDVQRQTQAQLIAQAERQAEMARQRAAKGWSIA